MKKKAIVFLFDITDRNNGQNHRAKRIYSAFQGMNDISIYQASELKEFIESIERFDSIYIECGTQPYWLNTTNLRHKILIDLFGFVSKKKNRNAEVTVFYRDIHWMFSRESRSVLARFYVRLIKLLHHIEIRQLIKSKITVGLPSKSMAEVIEAKIGRGLTYREMPPGCEEDAPNLRKKVRTNLINLLYVGNINNDQYDISELVDFCELNQIYLDIITQNTKIKYTEYTFIKVHYKINDWEKLNKRWDFFVDCRKVNDYLKFSSPLKWHQAISHGLPVLLCGEFETIDKLLEAKVLIKIDSPQDLTSVKNIRVSEKNIRAYVDHNLWNYRIYGNDF